MSAHHCWLRSVPPQKTLTPFATGIPRLRWKPASSDPGDTTWPSTVRGRESSTEFTKCGISSRRKLGWNFIPRGRATLLRITPSYAPVLGAILDSGTGRLAKGRGDGGPLAVPSPRLLPLPAGGRKEKKAGSHFKKCRRQMQLMHH